MRDVCTGNFLFVANPSLPRLHTIAGGVLLSRALKQKCTSSKFQKLQLKRGHFSTVATERNFEVLFPSGTKTLATSREKGSILFFVLSVKQ